jgi:hypothetical protein
VTQTLAGINDLAAGGFEPPDVQVAAGPGFVVQMVNLAVRVWRTSGGPAQQVQTQSLAAFFGSGGDRLTDPRIAYDARSSHWFATISNVETNSVVLAVSRTTDPTGAWSTYSFDSAGCADQPRLGIADGIVVIGADVFRSCDEAGPTPQLGAQLWIVNKQQLLAGATNVASTTYGPDRAFESLTPVHSLSSTSTEYVVSVDNPSSRVVRLLTVDGVPPGTVTVRPVASLAIAPLSQPPPGQQPPLSSVGRQPTVETNDDRILDAVWEDGKLWLSANTGCIPAGDTALRSCARIVQLSTATRTVDWDTDLGQPNAYIFYPAIRPDANGNLVIVYGESGQSVLPELVALGRASDGTFTAPAVIAQSASPHLGDRYGDYFGAARDPSHPELVWVTGAHGTDVSGTRGWSTSVASVEVTGVGVTPPQVLGKAPPPVRAQRVVARAGSTVRLPYRMLADGDGVREQVTIKAARRVVYRATTAKGNVRSQQVYFILWRPAKKLRGTFTWCVRSTSADGTQSPQSCATVTLR